MAKARKIRRVGLVGAGLIGGGWAARCLAHGLDVVATDPSPNAEARLRATVANAWPALKRVGLKPGASQSRLRFVNGLEAAVDGADFVQESATENEDLKRALHTRIDAAAPADVVIASSSSGLLPSRFQADCRHPERVLVGHPFNPAYLLPLVEILGGEKTAAWAIDGAAAFYQTLGMRPLKVKVEVPAFIADRLQHALWREALHLIADGVCSTSDIDDAIRFGPGLRWSFFGTCLIFHLAGGQEGMTHFMRQFGPLIGLPWSKLKGPAITPELVERLVQGTKAQAGGKSIQELERFRDDCLIEVEKVLAKVRARHGIDMPPGSPQLRKPARRARKPVAKKPQRRLAPGKSRPLTQSRRRPAKR
jgi:carnitine 3-dehydrogenase